MEGKFAKRENLLNDVHYVDRISNLPHDILYKILSNLPIKTIAKTSVLSNRWRQIWPNYPYLDITTTINKNTIENDDDDHGNLSIINQVLSLRDNKDVLRIRVLRIRVDSTFPDPENVFRIETNNNIQELDIQATKNDYFFKFPKCVLTSNSFRVLKLKSIKTHNQSVWSPPFLTWINGFRSLTSLSLCGINFDNQSSFHLKNESFPMLSNLSFKLCRKLKNLKVYCRRIQDLKLQNCYNLEKLRIGISILKNLYISGCFGCYSYSDHSSVIIDAPMLQTIYWSNSFTFHRKFSINSNSLKEVSVNFTVSNEDISVIQSLSQFFSEITSCESLILEIMFTEEDLCMENEFNLLTQPFIRLKSLVVQINFDYCIQPVLLDLFKNSPFIEKLVIIVSGDFVMRKIMREKWETWKRKKVVTTYAFDDEIFWESKSEVLKSFLDHLKVVKIINFSNCEDEMILLKFLLKYGKVLEEVYICYEKSKIFKPENELRNEKMKSKIMRLYRASSNAQFFVN